MQKEDFDIIRYKYDQGVYSLKKMQEFVKEKIITKEQFHYITTYDYDGLKKCGIG